MGLNVCDPKQEESCKKQDHSEEIHRWACSVCEKKRIEDIHPWALHLVDLRRLLKAGYPFGKNDLGYQEWMDLGLMNEMMER
jgi:hypothetical protein